MAQASGSEAGAAGDATPAVPPGYARAQLDTSAAGTQGQELWLLRVPDGMDVRQLDGVTIPLDTQGGKQLASVRDGDNVYELHASGRSRSSTDDSQLIHMAANDSGNAFFDRSYARDAAPPGAAGELESLVALLPTDSEHDTLQVAPGRVHRRLYLSMQAPAAEPAAASGPSEQPAGPQQPWDRLQSVFSPIGSLSSAPKAGRDAGDHKGHEKKDDKGKRSKEHKSERKKSHDESSESKRERKSKSHDDSESKKRKKHDKGDSPAKERKKKHKGE